MGAGWMLRPPRMINILLTAGDVQVARLVDPAEVAGDKPALRVECRLGRFLVVEIAEHQAGAAAADFADFARRGLDIRDVAADRGRCS
jgi:hypothetical protein